MRLLIHKLKWKRPDADGVQPTYLACDPKRDHSNIPLYPGVKTGETKCRRWAVTSCHDCLRLHGEQPAERKLRERNDERR